jgi:hypothetical protein
LPSWEVSYNFIMIKVIAVSALLALAGAKPAADAEADPQYLLGAAPAPYAAAPVAAAVPAANCKTVVEVLTTQVCTPTAENVCNTVTVDTEEIEYEKVCKEVQDMICDQPAVAVAPAAYHLAKREAEAEADAQYLSYGGYAGYAAAPVVAPVAHAVAHSVQTTVKHACRTVVTEHCVDNPIVKHVPVEVEHCHTVTKVACEPVDNEIPTTQCEPVTTEHLSHAAVAAPVAAAYHYGK